MSCLSSRCSRSNCGVSCASKASRLCPSIPPLPRFAFTFSQAISRFFRLYTLSISEWTFFAPVRLIQSTSLLRRERTGFSLMELFHLSPLYSSGFLSLPDHLRRLPSPTHFRRPPGGITRLSPRLWYYTAVRLLTEHRSPLRYRL